MSAGDGTGQVSAEGDRSTGAGSAPAAGALSTVPSGRVSSPDVIRAVLSGATRVAPPSPERATRLSPTVLAASGSAQVVDDGALQLRSLDDSLAELVARAEHTRVPFTLLLARPGPSGPVSAAGPTAGEIEDLAAALSVSLSPMQELLRAGPAHLAVILPGRTGAGQREAMRLTRRAAAEGAPLFSWAAARYPRDAATPAGLVDVASNRLDGRLVSRTDSFAPSPERGTGRYGAAVWAGVGAAVLVGAIAFALHGNGATPHVAAGQLQGGGGSGDGSSGGQLTGGAGAFGGSGAAGGSGGGTASGAPSGVSSGGTGGARGAPASGGSAGGTSGTSGTGTSGTSSTGTGGQQSGGLPVQTTLPLSNGPTLPVSTTIPGATTTTAANSTVTTTTTAGGSSDCTGVVQSLTCTANGLLGKLGL